MNCHRLDLLTASDATTLRRNIMSECSDIEQPIGNDTDWSNSSCIEMALYPVQRQVIKRKNANILV